MRNIFNFLLFVIPLYHIAQEVPAQNASSLVSNMAAPNVANMERFSESSVNYYNGKASTSIPIFTIKAGNITYPISLNYAAGGVQVNSVASDVGLGWSVTDTFVNRTIVGDADWETFPNVYKTNEDCNKIEYNPPGVSGMKSGYFYKIGKITTAPLTKVDYFPDFFKFNSPQNQTRFIFTNKDTVLDLDKKNTTVEWNVITKKYNYLTTTNYFSGNLENVNSQQCVTDYDNFTITTKDGIRYYFQDKDINHSYAASGNVYDALGSIAGTFPRVSSWHVSKITDNVTGQEINFIYDDYTTESSNDINTIQTNHHYYDCSGVKPTLSNTQSSCYLPQGSDTPGSFYYNRGLNIKRIKKITFPTGSVEFNYNQDRADLHNGKALTNVTIKDYNGKIINEFELVQDYFYSTLQKNEYSKRLKLLSVKERGKNNYQFDYYEDIQMPNIGSPFQDFFGYCNQVEINLAANIAKSSKYYYYPGKREFSLLPYNISTDNNHYLLNGIINKEPNELARTWSLKKVTFPTGGSKFFDLESNTFSLWDSNLKGGGVRVKQQILQESPSSPSRLINYYYTNGTNSSGYLFNVPYVGHPGSTLYDANLPGPPNISALDINNLDKYFFLYNSSRINYDILNNFFIGYSKVEENENGIKTIYEYYNDEYPNIQTRSHITQSGVTHFTSHCMSVFLVLNSALGNETYIDRSRLRGKLHFMHLYDKLNNKVKMQENVYKSFVENDYNPNPIDEFYVKGANVIQKPNTSGDNNQSFAELISTKQSYNSLYNNLSYVKITNFLPAGDVIEEKKFDHDTTTQNLLYQYHKVKNGSSYPYYRFTEYIYPYQSTGLNEPFAQSLVDINKIDVPLLTYNNEGEMDFTGQNQTSIISTSRSKVIFSKDSKTSNKILPVQTLVATAQNNFYEVGKFDRYDNKGNLLQSTSDGISTTYLYGYNQTLPIAKIVGATYEQVMSAFGVQTPTSTSYLQLNIVTLSNLDKNNSTENDLKKELDLFRAKNEFKDYEITTYTQDPLIGVKSVTPPNGMRETYEYDFLNRLKRIYDLNGRIIKEYNYHYAGQASVFYNGAKSQPFTKNNCSSGNGSVVTYSVPANKYFSDISQGAADQQAQDEIDTYGQTYANSNGTCTAFTSCVINRATYFASQTDNYISLQQITTNSVQVYLNLLPPNLAGTNMSWSGGVDVGTVSSACIPSSTSITNMTSTNRNWRITINTSGKIILTLISGTSPSAGNSSDRINLSFSYNK